MKLVLITLLGITALVVVMVAVTKAPIRDLVLAFLEPEPIADVVEADSSTPYCETFIPPGSLSGLSSD